MGSKSRTLVTFCQVHAVFIRRHLRPENYGLHSRLRKTWVKLARHPRQGRRSPHNQLGMQRGMPSCHERHPQALGSGQERLEHSFMIRCLSNRDRGRLWFRPPERRKRERNGQQPPPLALVNRDHLPTIRDSILAPLVTGGRRAAKRPLHHFDHW